jgi:hypothetical protein
MVGPPELETVGHPSNSGNRNLAILLFAPSLEIQVHSLKSVLGHFYRAWDSFIVPRFPSDRHFHRFWFSLALSIIDLLTVGLHFRNMLQILLALMNASA